MLNSIPNLCNIRTFISRFFFPGVLNRVLLPRGIFDSRTQTRTASKHHCHQHSGRCSSTHPINRNYIIVVTIGIVASLIHFVDASFDRNAVNALLNYNTMRRSFVIVKPSVRPFDSRPPTIETMLRLRTFSLFMMMSFGTVRLANAKAGTPQPIMSPRHTSSSSTKTDEETCSLPDGNFNRNSLLMNRQDMVDASFRDQFSSLGNESNGRRSDTIFSSLTHGVDLERQAVIEGDETQIVTITLQPGQTVRATPHSLIYRTDGVEMRTSIPEGLGRRLLTDTPIFQVDYVNTNRHKVGKVVLGRRLPSKVLRINLDEYGGKIVIRKGTLLLMSDPTKMQIGIKNARGILETLFGGQGFFQQTIQGEGQILLSSGGTQIRVDLKDDESIRVEPSTLVAHSSTVDYMVTKNTGWKNVLFGDENIYVTTLRGPGTVWLQGLNPKFFRKETVRVEHSDSHSRRSNIEEREKK